MDFGRESARNRRRVSLDGGYCDITSFSFQRGGRYNFGLAFHGSFLPPTSHSMNSTPSIQQPGSGVSDFVTIGLEEESQLGESGGLGAMFGYELRRGGPEQHIPIPASSQTNAHNEDLQPVSDGDLDANFDSEFGFPSQFDVAPERQERPYETVANDPLLDGVFGVDIPGQTINFADRLETNPAIPSDSQEVNFSFSTASKEINFSSNAPSEATHFSPSAANQVTRFNSHGFIQESANVLFDFSGSLEKDPNALLVSQETSASHAFNLHVASASPKTSFYSDFDQDAKDDIFGMDFLGGLETSPNVPSTTPGSQDTSFSQEFNPNSASSSQQTRFSQAFNPTTPSFSQQTSFSQELNPNPATSTQQTSFSQEDNPNTPPSSQETYFSTSSFLEPTTNLNTPSPGSPSPATTPTSSTSSPDRHSCRICNKTLKRPGDVKRHEKKHFPKEVTFHCWQLGCDRNGTKGFYRRDKLRDHEKIVHGL